MKTSTTYHTYQELSTMKELLSVVTRKGQITVPVEIRQAIGLKQGDRVAFQVEGDTVKITPTSSPIKESFQSVPALKKPLSFRVMTEIAHEEHAQEAAKEGLTK